MICHGAPPSQQEDNWKPTHFATANKQSTAHSTWMSTAAIHSTCARSCIWHQTVQANCTACCLNTAIARQQESPANGGRDHDPPFAVSSKLISTFCCCRCQVSTKTVTVWQNTSSSAAKTAAGGHDTGQITREQQPSKCPLTSGCATNHARFKRTSPSHTHFSQQEQMWCT